MAMAFGEDYIMILILENGGHLKLKVMVFTFGRMVIVTKVNGKNVLSMDKEQTFLQMEICTLGNIKKVNLKAKDSIRGRMVHSTLENSKMD